MIPEARHSDELAGFFIPMGFVASGARCSLRCAELRHTAATLLLESGVNPKIFSKMLGHARVSITPSLYSHVTPHMQQVAADAMDAALRG